MEAEWKTLIQRTKTGAGVFRVRDKSGRVVARIVRRKRKGRWEYEIRTRDGVTVLREEIACNPVPPGDNRN